MTATGRIEREFAAFKAEVEARLDALEGKKTATTTTTTKTTTKTETKKKDVVLETKGNDIVGTEVDAE